MKTIETTPEAPQVNSSAPEPDCERPAKSRPADKLPSTGWSMLDEHLDWLCRSAQTQAVPSFGPQR